MDNNDISKEEALKRYVSKRKKEDRKSEFVRSVFQVIAANLAAGISIYCVFTYEFNLTGIIMTILFSAFAIGLDWAFYTSYIQK